MSNSNQPTASAFLWNITAKNGATFELACYANSVLSGQVGFRTVYRATGGQWKYLLEPTIFEGDDFDKTTTAILEEISKKVRESFQLSNDQQPIPTNLFERVEQLLKSNVIWEDSNLVKK